MPGWEIQQFGTSNAMLRHVVEAGKSLQAFDELIANILEGVIRRIRLDRGKFVWISDGRMHSDRAP